MRSMVWHNIVSWMIIILKTLDMPQTLWYCIVLHGRRRCRGKEKGFRRRTIKMARGSKALGRSNYDWNKRKGEPYIKMLFGKNAKRSRWADGSLPRADSRKDFEFRLADEVPGMGWEVAQRIYGAPCPTADNIRLSEKLRTTHLSISWWLSNIKDFNNTNSKDV